MRNSGSCRAGRFFFSSRRRHTRSTRDWNSDVCSSDLALTFGARAEDYPNRPVRIVVSFSAGGPTDIVGRVIAQKLSELLGQQFFVENKVGAGGNIGDRKSVV